MEDADRSRIEKAVEEKNFEVARLYQQHKEYEERLHTLSRQVYLTQKEEQEQRELKQRKLWGVERMLKLTLDDLQEKAA